MKAAYTAANISDRSSCSTLEATLPMFNKDLILE